MFAGIVGFVLGTTSQLFQLRSEIEKFYMKPSVKFSITQPDAYAITIDVLASKIVRPPSDSKDFPIKWLAIPIMAEFNNPTGSPVSFRNLELTYLVREREGLKPCEDPYYYRDEHYGGGKHGGFYTWILRDRDLNPGEDINVPVTIAANQTRNINIDFLTLPLIPEALASAKGVDMNSFNAFCVRWVDQAGARYVSDVYRPLDRSRLPSNPSLQGTR